MPTRVACTKFVKVVKPLRHKRSWDSPISFESFGTLVQEVNEILAREQLAIQRCFETFGDKEGLSWSAGSRINSKTSEDPNEVQVIALPSQLPPTVEESKPSDVSHAWLAGPSEADSSHDKPPVDDDDFSSRTQSEDESPTQPRSQNPMNRANTTKSLMDMADRFRPNESDVKKRRTRQSRVLLASKSKLEEMMAEKTFLQRLTTSRVYEVSSGLLILLNSFFVGYVTQFEADSMAAKARDNVANSAAELSMPMSFFQIQIVFTAAFIMELSLRIASEGCISFFNPYQDDFSWNLFDALIVLCSLLDCVLELVNLLLVGGSTGALGGISVLRVLRVLRVVRVIRIIRVMRFFRELRMMVYSTMGCAKSLVWISMIFGIIFYIFGIAFVASVLSHLTKPDDWKKEQYHDLVLYFGSVPSATLALYQSISGGDDWQNFYAALESTGGAEKYLFLLYITFTLFAVVNVVTGVFVDTAMVVGKEDREVMVHEELENRKQYLATLADLFAALDADDSGQMSRQEFLCVMRQEKVTAFFKALKLDTRNSNKLFDLLDRDSSGEIDIDEFIKGCMELMGEPSAMDAKIMHAEVSFIKEAFIQVQKDLADMKEKHLPGGQH